MAKIEEWGTRVGHLNERANTLREQAGGAVNVQQVLGGWQAIPEGTRMRHRMRIQDATEDELAMAFFALRQLARAGRLGAHESRGEGYFRAEYHLRLASKGGDFEEAGMLHIADLALRINTEKSLLNAAFERCTTIVDDLAVESA